MPEYEIILTDEAKADLNELDDYITYDLHAPDTAEAYVDRILDKIDTLMDYPNRYRLVDEEPWHSRGVHRMNAEGFGVFYLVDDDNFSVRVQNVIYQKRDIPKVLEELYPDSF